MTPSHSKVANEKGKILFSQKVEKYIQDAIYRGNLRPRERVIEEDVARQLGVSRGTVREGLLRLERDGLIVITPRRGTFIRDISVDEMRVIFSMRGKLEGLCVRFMRENMKRNTAKILYTALRKMQKAVACNDDEAFFYADMELHHKIWELSGEPLLVRNLNSVMNPFVFLIARTYTYRYPRLKRFENHKEYIDMILKTPLNRVERKVERYFEKLYQYFSVPRLPVVHSATNS
jgi:DNA-binding GntR family transcriptional regulator